MAKIRIGIVGTGGMANAHARFFKGMRGVEMTACFDLDTERAIAYAERHAVRYAVDSLPRLLDAVDAVAVVTSDASHASISLQTLKAGKHLFCEKPLTVTLAEARKVARAYREARGKGVIGMVNFSHRGAHFDRAVEMVQRGDLGDLRYIRSHYLQGFLASKGGWQSPAALWRLQTSKGSAGVLGDLGCHLLDFTTGVCGSLRGLRCTMATHPKIDSEGKACTRFDGAALDANDTVTIDLDFSDHTYGHCQTTRWACGRRNDVKLEVHGTEGGVSLGHTHPDKPFIRLFKARDLKKATWKDVRVPPITWTWRRFIRAIRTGKPEQPDITRGAEIQALLDACQRSAKSGKRERVRKWC